MSVSAFLLLLTLIVRRFIRDDGNGIINALDALKTEKIIRVVGVHELLKILSRHINLSQIPMTVKEALYRYNDHIVPANPTGSIWGKST